MKKLIVLSALFLVIFISCSDKDNPAGGSNSDLFFSGRVVDAGGDPLQGVRVHYEAEFSDSIIGKQHPFETMPSTRINFSIPYPAKVTLVVLAYYTRDTITYLINNEQINPGAHSVEMNLNSLTNSIYIYVLKYDTTLIEREFYLFRPLMELTEAIPLATTNKDGYFRLHYKRLGIGVKFPLTSEASPAIIGYRTVTDQFKLLLYEPTYSPLIETVKVDTNIISTKSFILRR